MADVTAEMEISLCIEQNFPQHVHHTVLLFVGHSGIERQGNRTFTMRLGLRELSFVKAEVPIIGLQVHRYIVDVYADAALSQRLENIAVTCGIRPAVQPNYVKVECRSISAQYR